MTEEEWLRFVSGKGDDIRRICRVRKSICRYLQSDTDKVLIRRDYALKLIYKHQITYFQLTLISHAIDHGTVISDRSPNCVTFLYEDSHSLWQVTIKAIADKEEIYVSTFHRMRKNEAKRKLRKYDILAI